MILCVDVKKLKTHFTKMVALNEELRQMFVFYKSRSTTMMNVPEKKVILQSIYN